VTTTTPTRVLVAEDDAIIRLDLREMLQEEGFEVLEAGDGAAAVELARAQRPDLILLDVKMPVMDGLTAARQLSEERIAPIVILTAYSQRELVEQAAQAGAMAYLIKPFQKHDLLPAIEIARGRYEQIAALENEVGDLSERLEARKLIDRAKGKLMDEQSLSEADAFKVLQRAAMGQRVPMRQVAERVLNGDPIDLV
jgi:two-component system, response regulator PdtaR